MKVRSLVTKTLTVALAFSVIAPMTPTSSALADTSETPATSHLKVSVSGKTFDVPDTCLTAYSAVDTATVTNWVKYVASKVNHSAVNASYKVNKKKKRLDFTKSKTGFAVNQSASVSALCQTLASVTASSTTSTISLPGGTVQPKKPTSKLGKQILVILSKRKFYLYNNGKVQKTYRCAVGQPAWPTPTGSFHIGKKVKNPSWTNGGASWSKNMPAYIGPSPNNPLGTRALYVYNSKGKDTGVRFHGVPHSEDSSIGHAASHGCLRMHRKDVEKFYPLVKVGTPVYIIK